MTEPNSATSRPPLHRVTKGPHKSATVTIIETSGPSGKRMQALVHDAKTDESFSVLLTSLERIFRTGEEKELGRDFTTEEAATYDRQWETRYTSFTEERTRTAIDEAVSRMAERLERAAAELRHSLTLASQTPAERAMHAQHELNWLFPNLGTDQLTRDAIEWTAASRDLKRLLTQGLEPA